MNPGPLPPPRRGIFDEVRLDRAILVVEVAAESDGDQARWAVVVRVVDGPEISVQSGRLTPGTRAEAALEALRIGLDVVAETDPQARVSIRGADEVVGHVVVDTQLPRGAAEALLTVRQD